MSGDMSTPDKTPRRITLVVCPVCGQVATSNVILRPEHNYRSKPCSGRPRGVMYLRDDPKASAR